MATLHLVNHSASSSKALASCLAFARDGDVVLLTEDGVYSALPAVFSALDVRNVTVYALSEDVLARGLVDRLADQVETVSYETFVALTEAHNPIVPWC